MLVYRDSSMEAESEENELYEPFEGQTYEDFQSYWKNYCNRLLPTRELPTHQHSIKKLQ